MTAYTAAFLRDLPPQSKQNFLFSLTQSEALALLYDWRFWAREKQLPPDNSNWRKWLIEAGRGFGKTRTGAETIRAWVETKACKRLALVGATAGDVRDVMVEGESGILAVSPPWFMPHYEPSKRRITWPNGAMATLFSAEEPKRLRGPSHDGAWCDEISTWRYPQAWDMLKFGLRLQGNLTRCVITATPIPSEFYLKLRKENNIHITNGNTYENINNLAPSFIEDIVANYEGTSLGQQELYAQILNDNPNALWKRQWIESNRVFDYPELMQIIIGIDPPGGKTECGIVAAGRGANGHYYVLDDKSLRASPERWASAAIVLYKSLKANFIVGETNYGGDMVVSTIKNAKETDTTVTMKTVTATRGKSIRAEPIVALYEKNKVHHIGNLSRLEQELCTWIPNSNMSSPNRLDALVWAITGLMGNAAGGWAWGAG